MQNDGGSMPARSIPLYTRDVAAPDLAFSGAGAHPWAAFDEQEMKST
ncbi:hypothetical protein ACMHYB_48085 [Sorangium sp. So ce1128]